MKNIFTLIIIILLFASCNLFNRYDGFSKTKTGIYYKLHVVGEAVAPPVAGNYVTVSISYSTTKDSVFFTGSRTFQLTSPEFKGSIDECFLMMSVGDSASFIIDGKKFFTKTLEATLPKFFAHGDKIKVDMRLDEIRTEKQYQNDKAEFLKWIEDFGEYEKFLLSNFIAEEAIGIKPLDNGMYFIPVEEGVGKPVEPGDMVTVDYEGKFLNGKFFDSTTKRRQPFEFVYGTEMQVITGLDVAIGRMREGEKAIVILPSGLAWGDKGSSTGTIPPFTTVIYEVRLIKSESRLLN